MFFNIADIIDVQNFLELLLLKYIFACQ